MKIIARIENVGARVDKVVSEIATDISRSQIQQLVKDGHLLVNDAPVKTKYKLKLDDIITFEIPEPVPLEVKAVAMDLDICYEDTDVIVVNKPTGMVVHPAAGHQDDTLVNGLVAQVTDLSGINGVMRPGIVHRIDKDTSGLLMVAKNDQAHEHLVKQLQAKTVTRRYIALVHGVISHQRGKIDAPIGRDVTDRLKMTTTHINSKEAITHFTVLERFKNYTLVECRLETGRTHQIRVHMNYIGFPLVGDPLYGPQKTITRKHGQFLHAKTLGFIHPKTEEYLEFSTPLPDYFTEVIETLRQQVIDLQR
ncbi:MAG: RluA family pseudouridine synthase [Culicoidibacterales bacterium]